MASSDRLLFASGLPALAASDFQPVYISTQCCDWTPDLMYNIPEPHNNIPEPHIFAFTPQKIQTLIR